MAALHRLANGVRVVCDPITGFETLALSVVVGRGARWEDEHRQGWSHLLEHMVFKGAGERSARDIVEVIEADGGQLNAATGYERTSFQLRALAGGLPLGMAVIADLVFAPVLDSAELQREKGVIAQEIAEAADMPDDLVFDIAQSAAFGDHPLGRPILGTVEAIGTATRSELAGFRAGLYAPDRIIVSAAGAVDEDELLKETERLFGEQPIHTLWPEPSAPEFHGGLVTRQSKLEQAHLVLLLPGFGAADPDYFALRIFTEALGGGMSSRLFQEVREKRGLAYNIDAYADTYADVGVVGVYAGCAAKDAAETARVTAAEIRALAASIGAAELARCRAQLKASLFMGRESALSRAEHAAGQVLMFDRLLTTQKIAGAIDAVTAADIARVGERLLAPGKCAAAVLGPKASLAAAAEFRHAVMA
ncbi:MAG TPA: pitrilysin family protein [Caulobacteraceae bacterium]|nr:pitrilysin family protein [Caulobacteraceae bacterium]